MNSGEQKVRKALAMPIETNDAPTLKDVARLLRRFADHIEEPHVPVRPAYTRRALMDKIVEFVEDHTGAGTATLDDLRSMLNELDHRAYWDGHDEVWL